MKKILLNTVNTKSPNYKKYSALVDDEDFMRVSVHNWSVGRIKNVFYATSCINGKTVSMHTFITGYKLTDHKDHDGLNNQKSNLREVTQQQNNMNCRSRRNSTSKYKGVSWFKSRNKWEVYICADYKQIHLGYFLSEVEAAQAYNTKAIELFGEFANLNSIQQ